MEFQSKITTRGSLHQLTSVGEPAKFLAEMIRENVDLNLMYKDGETEPGASALDQCINFMSGYLNGVHVGSRPCQTS